MVINKAKDNENGKNIVLLKSGNTSTCFKHNTFTFSKPITSKKKNLTTKKKFPKSSKESTPVAIIVINKVKNNENG